MENYRPFLEQLEDRLVLASRTLDWMPVGTSCDWFVPGNWADEATGVAALAAPGQEDVVNFFAGSTSQCTIYGPSNGLASCKLLHINSGWNGVISLLGNNTVLAVDGFNETGTGTSYLNSGTIRSEGNSTELLFVGGIATDGGTSFAQQSGALSVYFYDNVNFKFRVAGCSIGAALWVGTNAGTGAADVAVVTFSVSLSPWTLTSAGAVNVSADGYLHFSEDQDIIYTGTTPPTLTNFGVVDRTTPQSVKIEWAVVNLGQFDLKDGANLVLDAVTDTGPVGYVQPSTVVNQTPVTTLWADSSLWLGSQTLGYGTMTISQGTLQLKRTAGFDPNYFLNGSLTVNGTGIVNLTCPVLNGAFVYTSLAVTGSFLMTDRSILFGSVNPVSLFICDDISAATVTIQGNASIDVTTNTGLLASGDHSYQLVSSATSFTGDFASFTLHGYNWPVHGKQGLNWDVGGAVVPNNT